MSPGDTCLISLGDKATSCELWDNNPIAPVLQYSVHLSSRSHFLFDLTLFGLLQVGPFTATIVENIEGDDINRVEQTYMESTGQPGDLRISRVGRYGEKKVAGSTFVHIRE